MNNFTYPVLLENDSAYKSEYYFRLENVEHKFDECNMYVELDCILNSTLLNDLIHEKKAYILISATTTINKTVVKIDNANQKIEITIPLSSLIDSDNVLLEANILVKKEFELKYCDEMDVIYKKFKAKKMKKNMQLAISNSVILYYRTVENTFVALSKSLELENKGIRVEYDNSDSILIKAGNSFCDAYNVLANEDPVVKEIMNCFISFIGIYQTSLAIKNNMELLDTIKKYEWYEGFEFLFAQRGKTLSDFFENDAEGPQELFESIQEILGNEIEKTFVRCRELLNVKGGIENE